MPDWRRFKKLLYDDSQRILGAFFTKSRDESDPIAAIGYVYEFGRGQLCFELCANSAKAAQKAVERFGKKLSADEIRWNSGNFDYSGGVQDHFGGWSTELWDTVSELDAIAEDDDDEAGKIHDRVARICGEILADLAREGVFGDWTQIDFNVAALLDPVETVKQRDAEIRRLMPSGVKPEKKSPSKKSTKRKKG